MPDHLLCRGGSICDRLQWPHWLALAPVASFFTQKSHAATGRSHNTLSSNEFRLLSGIFDSIARSTSSHRWPMRANDLALAVPSNKLADVRWHWLCQPAMMGNQSRNNGCLQQHRVRNSAILGFIPARRVGAERCTPRVDEIARADGADAAGVVVPRMRSESRFVARIRR